jgi:tetratricopeptide (TPR) repeat protein
MRFSDTSVEEFTRQAERLMLAGDLSEARRLCREMGKVYPRHAQSHYLLGVVCMQEAKPQLAQVHFLQALKCDPDNVDCYYSLAVAAQALGRLHEAISHLQKGLRRAPEDAELYRLHGELLIAIGRREEGAASLRQAAQWEKADLRASDAGTADPALDVVVTPEQRQHLERCRRLLQMGDRQEAEQEARSLLATTPEWAEVHAALADALLAQNRLPEAEASYRTAIALDDRMAGSLERLGAILTLQCKLNDAEACYRRALALDPDSPAIQSALGLVLGRQGLPEEGDILCREALHKAPEDVTCLIHAGQSAGMNGRYDEAQSLLERAVALQPEEPRAHLNLAVLLLKRGDFTRGWQEYEWRKRVQPDRPAPRRPEWDGTPFPNRTLLVYAEQGLGDTIQFTRLLPLVKARGGSVVLEVAPALTGLLQHLPGCDAVVAPAGMRELYGTVHDLEISLLSLPGLLRIDTGNIPPSLLEVAPTLIERRQSRLAEDSAYRVGLAWAGNRNHILDHLRSLPLPQLAPLAAVEGVHYYSLQKGEAALQIPNLPATMRLTDLSADLHDLADTAAMIANLDLVISVDTAVAHLAGALGKPVWTLLAYDPDWRWLLDREDSPWYSTMRLFRQPRPGDWTAVIADVCRKLQESIRFTATSVAPRDERLRRNSDLRPQVRAGAQSVPHLANFVASLPAIQRARGTDPAPTVHHSINSELERCVTFLNNGQPAEAEALAGRILAQQPDHPHAQRVLAEALMAQGRHAEAETWLRALLRQHPDPGVYNLLGITLSMQNSLLDAEICYRTGLALQPDYDPLLGNLGTLLGRIGKFTESEQVCRAVLRHDPNNAHAYASLGAAADYQGRYEEAEILFERALALQPDYPEMRLALGVLRLRNGDFARGWPGYEQRPSLTRSRRMFPQPRWDGSPAPDKTLLVYVDQGLGDAIQFLRFLPLVKQRVGRVLLECHPELTTLLQTNRSDGFVDCDVLESLADRPQTEYDMQISLGSLPGLFVTDLESIPNRSPYLTAPEAERQRWQQRFSGERGYKVGLIWAGNRQYLLDRFRSITLSQLAPLARRTQVRYYSLQKGEAAAQFHGLPSDFHVTDLSPELHDMVQTAAVIANLDLVISVDTAVAHLAGALGRPVWTLLPYSPDWRWLLAREDTPWYPTMRLFRQPQPGDWTAVIAAVCRELSVFTAGLPRP